MLTVLREALRRGGYRVTTAASAEEAIDLMHKRRFDLVLTDKNLPGASGLDVLRAARNLTPAPAIVLITGYSLASIRRSRRWTSARTTTSRSRSATSRICASASGARCPAATSSWRARADATARARRPRAAGRGRGRAAAADRRVSWARQLPRHRGQGRRRGARAAEAAPTSIWCWPIATCPAVGAARDRARAAAAAPLRVGALHGLPLLRVGARKRSRSASTRIWCGRATI